MKTEPIQACGSFDLLANEYSLTICSGSLVVSIDFLKREDIEHLMSCLECMLVDENTEEQ